MRFFIRTDASLQIGSGHVMRCLTLANELRQKACVSFICLDLPGNMCNFIEKEGFFVHRLQSLGSNWQTDAMKTIAILATEKQLIDWLIVDHYYLDVQWEMAMRPYADKIMLIDDMANRRHDCDILLDQNLHADMEKRYHGLVPQHCKQLLGPKYALLRPEFSSARKTFRKRNGDIKRILIFMGGSDPTNETAKALTAIKLLNRPDITVNVVVGESNPHKVKIQQICAELPDATYHCQVSNMAELMVKADLAIGAGGSTNWERCCLGLPSIVMTIAENQEDLTNVLHEQGYLISLGQRQKVLAETIAQNLCDILNNPERMLSFVDRGKQLVDGNGAKRVSTMVEKA